MSLNSTIEDAYSMLMNKKRDNSVLDRVAYKLGVVDEVLDKVIGDIPDQLDTTGSELYLGGDAGMEEPIGRSEIIEEPPSQLMNRLETVLSTQATASTGQWWVASSNLKQYQQLRRLFTYWKEQYKIKSFQNKKECRQIFKRWRRATAIICHKRYQQQRKPQKQTPREKNMIRNNDIPKPVNWRTDNLEYISAMAQIEEAVRKENSSIFAWMDRDESEQLIESSIPLDALNSPLPRKTSPPSPFTPVKPTSLVVDTTAPLSESRGGSSLSPAITPPMRKNYCLAAGNAFASVMEAKMLHKSLLMWKIKTAHRRRQHALLEA